MLKLQAVMVVIKTTPLELVSQKLAEDEMLRPVVGNLFHTTDRFRVAIIFTDGPQKLRHINTKK